MVYKSSFSNTSMEGHAQKLIKKKSKELKAVPQPVLTKQLASFNKKFENLQEKYDNSAIMLIEKFVFPVSPSTLVGWFAYSYDKPDISLLPSGVVYKGGLKGLKKDEALLYNKLTNMIYLLKEMKKVVDKGTELVNKIDKQDMADAIGEDYAYMKTLINVFYGWSYASSYYNGMASSALAKKAKKAKVQKKPGALVMPGAYVSPIFELAPDINTPLGLALLKKNLSFPEIKFAKSTTEKYGKKAAIAVSQLAPSTMKDFKKDPVKQMNDFFKFVKELAEPGAGVKPIVKRLGKNKIQIEITADDLIFLIPIYGPGSMYIKDVKSYMKGEAGLGTVAIDAVCFGVDVVWMVNLGVKTATRVAGKYALTRLAKPGISAFTKQAEKEIFILCAEFVGKEGMKKEMKQLLRVAQNKGWHVVAEDLRRLGMMGGGISPQTIKQYLKFQNKIGKVKLWGKMRILEFESLASLMRFRKNFAFFLAREFSKHTNFKAVKALGNMLGGLSKSEKAIATHSILSSVLTFSKGAQNTLLKYIQKKGWKPLFNAVLKEIEKIGGKKMANKFVKEGLIDSAVLGEATSNALRKLLPKYAFAFKLSAFKIWAKEAAEIGVAHTLFIGIHRLAQYATGKIEEQEAKMRELDELNKALEDLNQVLSEKPPTVDEVYSEISESFGKGIEGKEL